MKRSFSHSLITLTAFSIVALIFLLGGCSTAKGEGFAIYLTRADIPPAQMEALSHVDLEEQPIISMSDIITYNAGTHEITLAKNAFNRILSLEVPVTGRSFMVCVDRNPIYWGAFWTPVSSIAFDGVTIWKPLSNQDPKVIQLELGYPSSSFYGGEDPRNNCEVIKSLEEAGKLIAMPEAKTVDKLPHSMKGYELYSWSEDNLWNFTLITGSNRNKTLEEIISEFDIVSEDGWVRVHVLGVEAIKTILCKLPQDEFILWLDKTLEQKGETDIRLQLPPDQTIDSIKEYARQCGLDFHVQ